MLTRPEIILEESLNDRMAIARRSMPKVRTTTAAFESLALEVPLFSIARAEKGVACPHVNVAWSRKGRGHLRYRGPQLNQSHQTVVFTLCNWLSGQDTTITFGFRPRDFLASMGWARTTQNVKRLRQLLDDLEQGSIRLWKDGQDEQTWAVRTRFLCRFVPAEPKDEGAEWTILLGEDLLNLFNFSGYSTFINLTERKKVKEGLSTFLYGWISASKCSIPFTYDEIRAASGSRDTDMREFGKSVRAALAKLKEVGAIQGFSTARGNFRVLKKMKAAEAAN